MKRVCIRADASIAIGSGHIMRCLTLAAELVSVGFEVEFICKNTQGNMISYISKQGYKVTALPASVLDWQEDGLLSAQVCSGKKNADWLIVDHYTLDWRWEEQVGKAASQVMVIDDLANRRHSCSLLLDQNWYSDPARRYQGLVSPACQLLLGLDYFLVRPEFCNFRKKARIRDGTIRRVLVFMGGADATNETEKVLKAWRSLAGNIAADVVVGNSNPNKNEIETLCCKLPNVVFHCQTEKMAELMADADLAVGAGGTAMWERAYLGLPSIMIQLADNQKEPMQCLVDSGLVINLGWYQNVSWEVIADTLVDCQNNSQRIADMSCNLARLFSATDDSGSGRIARILKEWSEG